MALYIEVDLTIHPFTSLLVESMFWPYYSCYRYSNYDVEDGVKAIRHIEIAEGKRYDIKR